MAALRLSGQGVPMEEQPASGCGGTMGMGRVCVSVCMRVCESVDV